MSRGLRACRVGNVYIRYSNRQRPRNQGRCPRGDRADRIVLKWMCVAISYLRDGADDSHDVYGPSHVHRRIREQS